MLAQILQDLGDHLAGQGYISNLDGGKTGSSAETTEEPKIEELVENPGFTEVAYIKNILQSPPILSDASLPPLSVVWQVYRISREAPRTLDKFINLHTITVMQIPHNEITGVILAGGKSRRMGCDKALLTLEGQPLVVHVRQALSKLCPRVQIAGERTDLAAVDLPVFADKYPGSSLGGLHNALQNTATEWVLVLPCDLPFPSPQLLQRLWKHRADVQAVIPRTAFGSDPLIACYHRSALPLIEEQLAAGKLRLTALMERLKVKYLSEEELPHGWRRALTNLNRPQDLKRLQAPPPVLTLVARSGTGKTTLLVKLIAELTARGWTVGALKHDAHKFTIDHKGKDSWKMAAAGAALTAISSPAKTALIQNHEIEPSFDQLLQPFVGKVDILLTEGFKRSSLPKIEVCRQELQHSLLCRGDYDDPTLLAVASDTQLPLDVPCLNLNDPAAISDFIERRCLT